MEGTMKMGTLPDSQAFPASIDVGNPLTGEHRHVVSYGLTKRELFAAMAMQGIASCDSGTSDPERIAKYSLKVADALIAALSK